MTSCWANIRSISARSKRRPRRWGRQRLAAVAADGSVGFQGQRRRGQKAHSLRQFPADPNLLAIAQSVKSDYRQGKVVEGVIGSADVWNSELDRIRYFHDRYRTSVEEMETASAAQIVAEFKVPFVGIRVLSNNITNQGKYDPQTGLACGIMSIRW